MTKSIYITKHSGEQEAFDVQKLIKSLRRSKAPESLIESVTKQVTAELRDGMSTRDIYRIAFRLLKQGSSVSASRYKLKKAIMELGPSGFPFEKFVGKVLEHEGYHTKVGVIVLGHCVQHEVDVAALKDDQHFMIECKFHSDQARFCDVKIPLYIQSRFLDVERKWQSQPGHHAKFHKGWVFTNTRFTSDAIQYGECMGLGLVSWDYPEQSSLKSRIDRAGLHPLTALTTLTKMEKSKLLGTGVVLCRELAEQSKLLKDLQIAPKRLERILEDSREICSHSGTDPVR